MTEFTNVKMTETPTKKVQFDLAERTYRFASNCRQSVRPLRKQSSLFSDIDQLVRASGSVAANYLEADEALSKKDFVMRIKICRKEARECQLWLRLLADEDSSASPLRKLQDEAYQLVKIFNAIIERST